MNILYFMLITGFNRNDAGLKYLRVQIHYTLLFHKKKNTF